MSKYILYDLPSKGHCVCWSPNPWKTRLALNFKNLPYETEWVEYPDIKSKLSPHVQPHPPGSQVSGDYTIPTIQPPNGKYIMDSKPIALALEEAHPSPSLHLDSPYLAKIEVLSPTIITPLVGFWIPLIPEKLLNPPSKEYFIRTREARYGVSLAQVAKAKATEEAWIEVLPPLKELGALLGENEEGHFLMGKTPSYADLVVVGWLQFFKAVDEAIYKRVVEIEPKLGELYNASKQWVKRDDH